MGQYPAVANFMHNVYSRVYYDPLHGALTQRKISDPVGVANRVTFVADVPKMRSIDPKTRGLFDTPEYKAAYEARWRQAHDTPKFRHMNSAWNVDIYNPSRVKTLGGVTDHSGKQGLVTQSHWEVVSQRILR